MNVFLTTKIFPLAALCVVALLLPSVSEAGLRDKRISDLTADDRSQNERQRRIISRIVRENFGMVRLEGSKADLYYLQRIVDRKLIGRHDGYDLQALGVILGDIMDKNLPVRWVIVEDQYGRSRALQYEGSKSLYYPITMISRRVQNNMKVDVRQLYKDTELSIRAIMYRESQFQQLPSEAAKDVSQS